MRCIFKSKNNLLLIILYFQKWHKNMWLIDNFYKIYQKEFCKLWRILYNRCIINHRLRSWCINVIRNNASRITYHIKLDEDNLVWVYCTYTTKRNEFREFIKSGVYVRCQVRADFDQVSLYNTFRRKKWRATN